MDKTISLKKNKDFKTVFNKGKSLADKYLVMYILENGLEINRLGIQVSKKVGNSVIRHHFTRLVREAYRLNEDRYKAGYDIVVIARVTAKDMNYHDVWNSLRRIAGRHGIFENAAK